MKSLIDWLAWLEKQRPSHRIELGLSRMQAVASRSQLHQFACPVITVTGTNGKGSCIATLEAIYNAARYKVASYTSPHLYIFNERIRVNQKPIEDHHLCAAFEAIDKQRGDVPLSYFEFTTLAAFYHFQQVQPDIIILEVGIGGRRDAVNVVDTDCAIVTAIDVDHQKWLGETRDDIAYEKAGIFREGKPVICGDMDPPLPLLNHAKGLHTPFLQLAEAFTYYEKRSHWSFKMGNHILSSLPTPTVILSNAACTMAAIEVLASALPVTENAIRDGLENVSIPGRCEWIEGEVNIVLDVAHNPHSVAHLAKQLSARIKKGRLLAVWSMLGDKDIPAIVKTIGNLFTHWYIAPLKVARAASLEQLVEGLQQSDITAVTCCKSIEEAFTTAKQAARIGDTIVVFGSFHTVAAVSNFFYALDKNDRRY